MRILVTGRDGQVGWELERCLAGLGEVIGVGRRQFDLARPKAVYAELDKMSPDVIVNAAAYTAVDRAETDEEAALTVNAAAPGELARWARRNGAALVHYSTDYVFDGSGDVPWRETDVPRPLSAYGRSKLAGEEAIRTGGCSHLILRTSWIYAMRGQNFLRTMLRLAGEREELRVVSDQIGAPTWARTLAQATAHILARAGASRAALTTSFADRGGTFHLASRGHCSWYDFANRIFELCPDPQRPLQGVTPISTQAYPTPALRPRNSRLCVAHAESTWNLQLPNWDDALRLCLAKSAG